MYLQLSHQANELSTKPYDYELSTEPLDGELSTEPLMIQAKWKMISLINQPAPVTLLTHGLGLDRVLDSEKELHELECDFISHHYDNFTKRCCWGSNLGLSDP